MYLLKRRRRREIHNCIAMIHLGRETWEMFVVVLGAFIIKVNVLTKKPESRDNNHKAKIYLKMKKKRDMFLYMAISRICNNNTLHSKNRKRSSIRTTTKWEVKKV